MNNRNHYYFNVPTHDFTKIDWFLFGTKKICYGSGLGLEVCSSSWNMIVSRHLKGEILHTNIV
jgi:hypothetical protein